MQPSHHGYHSYGGRGITICSRWSTFENFLADMGERPVGCTLDRIDNNGNYEPGNCRWATSKEQGNNRRVVYVLQQELDSAKAELARYKARFGALEVADAA